MQHVHTHFGIAARTACTNKGHTAVLLQEKREHPENKLHVYALVKRHLIVKIT